jgi:hypothetical protein
MIIGIVKTNGRQIFYFNAYHRGFDLIVNFLPRILGFYFWLNW